MPHSPGVAQGYTLGKNDVLYPQHLDNDLVTVNMGPPTLAVYNIFGGYSFYLNSIFLALDENAYYTGEVLDIGLYDAPNNNNIVGAFEIFRVKVFLPVSNPATPVGQNVLLNVSALGYHHKNGGNGYLHLTWVNAPSQGVLTCTVGGGASILNT